MPNLYTSADFESPKRACDLVMKGGITSGVVYPGAILELARDHRLVNVGGTSAGAIAAVLAAAAEYRRRRTGSGEGFVKLGAAVGELSNLVDLFQPHPRHRQTFEVLLELLRERKNPFSGIVSSLRFLRKAYRIYKSVQGLPETFFGLCTGLTQRKADDAPPALTDWLHRQIETVAGRRAGDQPATSPLTFAELEAHGVHLRTLTTDLGRKQPVLLPFQDAAWRFRKDELAQFFPADVVRYLVDRAPATAGEKDESPRGLYKVPQGSDLPVLVAARASLSFPFLLAALPLYRRDYTHRLSEDEREVQRCCWLSDGGISSNFPIHLFDSAVPARPTFGISLDRYSPTRHSDDPKDSRARVYLPEAAKEGLLQPVDEIEGPLEFGRAIFDAARNWQDSLQTSLPGYRERIAHIALSTDEGGLNLEMEKELLERLGGYGRMAGEDLAKFDLDEHKWRRLLSVYASLEVFFEEMATDYEDFKADLHKYDPKSYKPSPAAHRELLWQRMDALSALARQWSASPLREVWATKSGMPRPRTFLKFAPREQAGRD